jgi:hypothetical protein
MLNRVNKFFITYTECYKKIDQPKNYGSLLNRQIIGKNSRNRKYMTARGAGGLDFRPKAEKTGARPGFNVELGTARAARGLCGKNQEAAKPAMLAAWRRIYRIKES